MVISPGRSRVARALSYMQMKVVHLLINSLYLSPKLILICTRARTHARVHAAKQNHERKCDHVHCKKTSHLTSHLMMEASVTFLLAVIHANRLILQNLNVSDTKTDR